MKAKLLTLAALAAMFVGGLTMPSSADARPWRGYFGPYNTTYYYGRPAVGYYRGYYPYAYQSYRYYNYPYRYSYPYYYNYGPAYYYPGSGVYLGARPGFYFRY